ncbi:MAG: hypothetical protein U5N85_20680 [Arcicella sp.]|nr:hypothetical protein [Arcicella sp.]
MKNYFILTILSIFIFSCAGPTPEPGDEPLNLAEGKLIIKFTDPKLEAKNTTSAAKNEILALSFNIKKAVDGSLPVKLSAYITDNSEKKGILLLDNIRLKNKDEQTQSLEVILPEAGITITRVFYIEITDSKDKITRKALEITPSGTKQISAWSNVTLGVQGSGVSSRFSSTTGDLYTACDLDSNINFVDITYATIGSPSIKPTILSNPRRAALGLGNVASDKNCASVVATGGTTTYFAPLNSILDFTNVNDFVLSNLVISGTAQEIAVEVGKFYVFQHSRTTKDGKTVVRKGVLEVNSLNPTYTSSGATLTWGLINIDVKMQR